MATIEISTRWRTVGLMAGLMMGVLLTLMDQTVVSSHADHRRAIGRL